MRPKSAEPTTPVLEYGSPQTQKRDDETIVLNGAPLQPLELFPPYCCCCMKETRELWKALYEVRVPMCLNCRRRWSWIKWLSLVVPWLVLSVLAIWSFAGSKEPYAIVMMISAMLGVSLMVGVMNYYFVGWLLFPARVWAVRHDPHLYLRFRNRQYHRAARQWMDQGAGARIAAQRPGGYPVPPKHLKD